MKNLLMLAVSILTVASMTGVSVAARGLSITKTTEGEVTAVTKGKSVEVKDAKGKIHKFSLSEKTKIEGALKVGAKVDVHSKGRSALEVKVGGGAEAPAAPAAPAPPAATAPEK